MLSWQCHRKYGHDKNFIWQNKTDSQQEIIRTKDQGQLRKDHLDVRHIWSQFETYFPVCLKRWGSMHQNFYLSWLKYHDQFSGRQTGETNLCDVKCNFKCHGWKVLWHFICWSLLPLSGCRILCKYKILSQLLIKVSACSGQMKLFCFFKSAFNLAHPKSTSALKISSMI